MGVMIPVDAFLNLSGKIVEESEKWNGHLILRKAKDNTHIDLVLEHKKGEEKPIVLIENASDLAGIVLMCDKIIREINNGGIGPWRKSTSI